MYYQLWNIALTDIPMINSEFFHQQLARAQMKSPANCLTRISNFVKTINSI